MRLIDVKKLKDFLASKVVMMTDYDDGIEASRIDEYIDEFVASQQPEPHWIPTSERLPKISEDVLLSYFDEVTIGWLNGDGSWSIYDGWMCVSADEISAWMSLPKVFKENERESN